MTDAMRERIERRNAEAKRARDAHYDAVNWALSAGFTERQAPFAAQVAKAMKVARHGRSEVTASEVREQLMYERPSLFEPVGAQA